MSPQRRKWVLPIVVLLVSLAGAALLFLTRPRIETEPATSAATFCSSVTFQSMKLSMSG